ncbi:DNA topoisomerase IB [Verrucomicrobiota bacterium sgz303538]
MKQLDSTESTKPSPVESAKEAGLRYISDNVPGIQRMKRGKNFTYVAPNGNVIRDEEELTRFRKLAIPPAWTQVWISPMSNGHLQATGRDARGRKQYRYHANWHAVRDDTKYSRMMAFGRALPQIRRRVTEDLTLPGLPRNKVLATVVRLLETTLIRVGNEEYAKQNASFGLTTMLDEHAKIRGGKVTFEFKGKSGIQHHIDVNDPQLARLVKKCQDLPGQEIFAYIDDDGNVQDVSSQDVNAYVREITEQDFTAKDFRTWAGTVLAAVALREFEDFSTTKQAKKNIVRAVEGVAGMLGNTPAVCRRCYVHPAVLESYLDGTTIATLAQESTRALEENLHNLTSEEAAVMMLLRQRLAAATKQASSRTKAKDLSQKHSSAARRVPAAKKSGTRSKASRKRSKRSDRTTA